MLNGWLLGITIGLLSAGTLASAQTPLPAPASAVPDWVVKYAANQEQAARQCGVAMAQEQDKVEKLTRELADAKAALAKATPKPVVTPEKK